MHHDMYFLQRDQDSNKILKIARSFLIPYCKKSKVFGKFLTFTLFY